LGNGFFVHPSQVGGGGGSRTRPMSASRVTEALRLWSRWFSLSGSRFRGGAGSARPLGNAMVSPWYALVRSPASRLLLARHGMPGLVYGPTTRARRPRPSEKTAFRVISRFSPLGHASWACLPPEGRAPHARNVGMAPYRCISPLKPLVLLLGVPVSRRGGLCTPARECLGFTLVRPR